MQADLILRVADVVTAVNGICEPSQIIAALHTSQGSIELKFKRYRFITIRAWKDCPLGIVLAPEGNRLVGLRDGMVSKSNFSAKPGCEVVPGDKLLSINGQKGS